MSKIVVTGGAGFIGSHIVDALILKGHQVFVIDNLSTGSKKNINPKALFYKLDVLDPKIDRLFIQIKPTCVFHLAANIDLRKSMQDPVFDAGVNILGSLNILEAARKTRVKKIIFSSTGGALYGNAKIFPTPEGTKEEPLSPYGITKLTIEKYLDFYKKNYSIDFVSLRYSNVYGPRQNSKGDAGVVAIFIDHMLSGKKVTIHGDGKQTRDYIYISDVVSANLTALAKKKSGFFHISTAKECSVNDVAYIIKKATHSQSKIVYGEPKAGDVARSCISNAKTKRALGWKPCISFEQGIVKTVFWFQSNNLV